jgi:RNA polymerase sigma-70 factor (ECF subfamily)
MDEATWAKIKSGDRIAFRSLFDECYSPLCLYANSVINNVELSQDLVSDCFVRIWEKRETIQIRSSVKHYLLHSVRNAVYSYLRSPENRKEDMKDIIEKLENTPAEEYDLEKEETISHIKNLIYELPEQRRKILELAAFYGKTYQEIAEMLDISVNTVNTQMSRAYRFLRDNLSKDELLLLFFFRKYKII